MPVPVTPPQRAFEFRCLGPVTLTRPDGERVRFRTRKQMALLLLLAMRQGRPWPREQLIELLWSGDDEPSARHSLSQSVSLINKNLGAEAITGASKDQVVLREGLIRLDVAAFEERVSAKRFTEARDLWHGNLLEGLWIQRAPHFDRWLDEERQRLARDMRRVLRALIEAQRAEGDWEAMRATAEAILELDELDEAAMLAYLESLSLDGDRTLALRRYREFEARLKDELDAEPGAALRSWLKRHRKGDGAPAEDSATRRAPAGRVSETIVLPTALPVFGRHAEYAALWEAWEAARSGQGGFIILEGEPGIGKTALASKLVNQVHVAGGSACFVKCYRSEKSVPFAPISALIRQLSRLPGFVALSDTWIGELTRLVPELRERYPNAPQPMAVDDSARYRLCDATLQAAGCVADEHPLLVVVDDIQDADEATLALVHYFGRQSGTQPTVLLCVARSSQEHSELQRVFFETARSAGFARFLELGALADAEIRRIAHQVLAQRGLEAPEWALEKLTELSRGNPLHAGELAMAIPGRDGQPTEEWLHQLREQADGEESFERTSTERLTQLSEQARRIAAVLAVAGRPLSDHELAAVTALPLAELAAAITALEDAHFIRRAGATLGFAHEQYFLSANAMTPAKQREEIHLRLAKHLTKSAADNPAARYEVARHYEGALRFREARAQAQAAAKYAASVGAVREHAAALELMRRVTRSYDGALSAELGECYLALKDFDHVGSLCAEARSQHGMPAEYSRAFSYLGLAADFYAGRASPTHVKIALTELLTNKLDSFAQELDASILLMRIGGKTGDFRLARRIARMLRHGELGRARSQRSPHAFLASAYVFSQYFRPAKSLPLVETALRLSQAEQNWSLEIVCRDGMCAVLKQMGRYADSIQQQEYGIALARRILDPQAEALGLNNTAVSLMALGRFPEAERKLMESAEIDRRYPNWPIRAYRIVNSAELHFLMGSLDQAAVGFAEAADIAVPADLSAVAISCYSGLAMCAQRRHDDEVMRRFCRKARDIADGRERLSHDRWLQEAAYAWDLVLSGEQEQSIRALEAAARDLSRRDVDQWLHLELEMVRVREHISGAQATAERERLATIARRYGARYIEEAASRTDQPPPTC